tara:strand:- start:7948 stop:8337 length:390 start_codon:yes stop_codon:yes gene_type:complete
MDALTRLKAAVSMAAIKKEVPLPDGTNFEFYMTPMTLAERAKAKKMTKSEDPTDFALRLLINKAKDKNDEPLFHVGNLPELRNELPATLVEQLMVQLIGEDEEEEGEVQKELDVKSLGEGTKKRRRAAG